MTTTRTAHTDAGPTPARRDRGPYIGAWVDEETRATFEELRRRWGLSQTDALKRMIELTANLTKMAA